MLHIIKSLGRGGAERLLPETLAVHSKEQFTFHYIYFLPWKNQMVADLEANGGIVTCIAANNNLQLLLSINKIVAYIKTHKISIIHAHLPWAGVVARLAGKIANVPVIYTEHNKWQRYHPFTYWLNKLTFSLQHTVVAVSKDVEASIRKSYSKVNPIITTIPNGVNTNTFVKDGADISIRNSLQIPATSKVIGIVSVFRTQKRLHLWLQVAKKIYATLPDTHFIIVGDGPLKEPLLKQWQEEKLEKFVHFVGLQTEVRPYYNAMDVFMMTSEFEGLPIALLEAMSMGCVPVCTNAGGIGEVIRHKENGLLFPVNDTASMVNEIIAVLNTEDLLHKYGIRARKTVIDNNSMIAMVQSLETLYFKSLS